MSVKTVLFLCTGNYYRSRFAEGLFNHLASQLRLGWQAHSGGLAVERTEAVNVGPIANHTLEAFKQRSISVCRTHSLPQGSHSGRFHLR